MYPFGRIIFKSLTPEIEVFVSVSKHFTDLNILLCCVVAPQIMYIKVLTEAVPALVSYHHVRTMFPNTTDE